MIRRASILVGGVLSIAVAPPLHAAEAPRSHPPSRVFTAAQNLANTPTYSEMGAIALDDGPGVYVAWGELVDAEILFAASADGGATFGPARTIVPQAGGAAFEQLAMRARGAGEIHLALTAFDTDFGGAEVLYLRSMDGGATFAPPLQVSVTDAFNSYVPAVDVGWAVAVSWTDDDVDTGQTAIRYSQSLDGGSTFSAPRTLSSPAAGPTLCSDIGLTGTGTTYVAWMQGIHPNEDIYFSRSLDGGGTFSTPIDISNLPEKSWCPHIAVAAGGTIHVVWAEGAAFTDRKLMATRSTDGGQTFSTPQVVSDPAVDMAIDPRIAVAGAGTVLLTWGTGDIATGDLDCFVARSTDGGATFSAPVPTPGCGPMAARAANRLHTAFPRTLPGQSWPDTFYSRGDDLVFPVFWDVPVDHFARTFIESVYAAGVTGGCAVAPLRYCPESMVTRAQMATFLLRSKEGPAYVPLPATGLFADVPVSDPFAPWIEDLYGRSVTGGCSVLPLKYCPAGVTTRAQMAVFLLRTKEGPSYVPPQATGMFDDVPVSDPFAPWIEELARRGVTGGCSTLPPLYCPTQPVSRASMAVFLVRMFGLPL